MKYSEKSIYYTMDLNNKIFDPLTTEQEVELLTRYKENKDMEAREELIRRNLRFVNKVIRNTFGSICASNPRFDMQTLFQEGVIGLMEGLEYFDMSKEVKFLTYAHYRIMKHTWLYVYNNTSSMSGCMSLHRDYNRILNILRKEPDLTYEEISERLNNVRSPRGVENIIKTMENKTTTPVYDHLVNDDGEEHSLIELVSHVSSDEAIESEIHNKELRKLIDKIIEDKAIFSNDKARTYFKEYFLNGKSYREIAEKYGVSHQAIHNSVQKRIDYIKRNYSHLLMEFVK